MLSSAVLFVGAVLLWALTTPFDRNGRVLHLYSCFWARLYLYVNPLWSLRVAGASTCPGRARRCWCPTTSRWATSWCSSASTGPSSGCRKAENFKLPFIGWNMRLNRYVPLVRGDRESVLRMLGPVRDLARARGARPHVPRGHPLTGRAGEGLQGRRLRAGEEARLPHHPGGAHRHRAHPAQARPGAAGAPRAATSKSCRRWTRRLPDVPALREHVRGLIIAEKARLEAVTSTGSKP